MLFAEGFYYTFSFVDRESKELFRRYIVCDKNHTVYTGMSVEGYIDLQTKTMPDGQEGLWTVTVRAIGHHIYTKKIEIKNSKRAGSEGSMTGVIAWSDVFSDEK